MRYKRRGEPGGDEIIIPPYTRMVIPGAGPPEDANDSTVMHFIVFFRGGARNSHSARRLASKIKDHVRA